MVPGDGCTACGEAAENKLYARVDPSRRLCYDCWKAQGFPAPRPTPPSQEHEQRIRERMKLRGGADRHRVNAGKS